MTGWPEESPACALAHPACAKLTGCTLRLVSMISSQLVIWKNTFSDFIGFLAERVGDLTRVGKHPRLHRRDALSSLFWRVETGFFDLILFFLRGCGKSGGGVGYFSLWRGSVRVRVLDSLGTVGWLRSSGLSGRGLTFTF